MFLLYSYDEHQYTNDDYVSGIRVTHQRISTPKKNLYNISEILALTFLHGGVDLLNTGTNGNKCQRPAYHQFLLPPFPPPLELQIC